jgi:hypothetical protein
MKYFLIIIFIFSSIFLSSCKDDFSPTGELSKSYAVYSILDNRQKNQIVLLQKLFLNSNSIEKLENVKVILSESGGQNYTLKDTILSDYKNFNAYYLPNYTLKRDIMYRLTVWHIEYPLMWSDTYINPAPNSTNYLVSEQKIVNKDGTLWRYTVTSPKPKNNPCLIRLFIDVIYSYADQYLMPQSKTFRLEIPMSFIQNITIEESDYGKKIYEFSSGAFTPVYSSYITSNKWDPFFTVTETSIRTSIDDNNILFALLNQINVRPDYLTVKRAYVIDCNLDASLYENFIASRPNTYSVRLDEPFVYTNFNIENNTAFGYFGSVTADTCVFKIDPAIFERFGFKNGQK